MTLQGLVTSLFALVAATQVSALLPRFENEAIIEKRAFTCTNDPCLEVFELFAVVAKPFCSTYTKTPVHTVPAFAARWSNVPSKISSACSCIHTGKPTSTLASTSDVTTSSTISDSVPTAVIDVPSTSIVESTTQISSIVSSTTVPDPCYVTAYSAVPSATAACTAITLDGITVPGNSTLDLSKLLAGTKVTFAGFTFWEYADANYPLIKVGGTNIEITADTGAILDGNGQSWWDGLGSNGGIAKPNHFIEVSKALGSSSIHDIYIQNYPVHCFSISGCSGLDIYHITLNNSAGYAPNNRSGNLAASHNSDGFDLSSCNDTTVRDSTVLNQDDCVAVTSGNNIIVSNMYCNGSHGLSIGSVGGKSNNNVTNILFENSVVLNAENGARIKTNYNTTGYISNITFQNIYVENISIYGVDVQQDYLNGGPTGDPSNGVIIKDIYMTNITGIALSKARDYYILCGEGSCSNFVFNNINVTGGTNSSCNFQPEGNFSCTDS